MNTAIVVLVTLASIFTVMGWSIPAHNRLNRFFAAEFAIAGAIVGMAAGSIGGAIALGIMATINIIANY